MQKSLPAARWAITNAAIATILPTGEMVVRKYKSGERLGGRLSDDGDAPPFTGFVRDFGKKKGH